MSEYLDFAEQEAALRFSVKKVENKLGGLSPIVVEIDKPKKLTAQINDLKAEVNGVIQEYLTLKGATNEVDHAEELEQLEALVSGLRQKIIEYFVSALESQIKVGPSKNFPSVVRAAVKNLLGDRSFASKYDIDAFADRIQVINETVRVLEGTGSSVSQPPPLAEAQQNKGEQDNMPAEVVKGVEETEKLFADLDAASNAAGFLSAAEYQGSGKSAYEFLETSVRLIRDITVDWVEFYDTNASHALAETKLRKRIAVLDKEAVRIREKLIQKDPAFIALRQRADEIAREIAAGHIKVDGTQNVDALLTELFNLSVTFEDGVAAALKDPTIGGDIKKHPEYGAQLATILRAEKELADKLQFAQWINKLETTHTTLATLRVQHAAIPNPVVGDPQPTLTTLEANTAAARAQVAADMADPEKKAYLDDHYFKDADITIARLKKEQKTFEEQEALAAFNLAVKPLQDAIDAAPTSITGQTLQTLTAARDLIQTEYTTASQAGLLDKSASKPQLINEQIDKLMRLYQDARKMLSELMVDIERPKPVEQMTVLEVAEEVHRRNMSYEDWNDKIPKSDRDKALLGRFRAEVWSSQLADTDPAKHELMIWKIRTGLKRLDNLLEHGRMFASGDITKLDETLNSTQLTRQELMAATTENPEYGDAIKKALRFVIETAALRPGEAVVMRGGRKEVICTRKIRNAAGAVIGTEQYHPSDGTVSDPTTEPRILQHIPGMSYDDLAGESGRYTVLPAMIEKALDPATGLGIALPAGREDLVKELTARLFCSFDMLTISLTEMQKRTKTRSHNGSLEDINRIAMYDPWADAVHGSERYGGRDKYYMLWMTVYGPHLPDGVYGDDTDISPGVVDSDKHIGDSRKINEAGELAILHQECFFDMDDIADTVEPPGFCESMFPDTYNLLVLQAGEQIRWGNQLLKENGVSVPANPADASKYKNMDNYFTAVRGWKAYLEKIYGSMPKSLTFSQILEQSTGGAKGGLYGELLGDMIGLAKMFEGPHLRKMLVPTLTHFTKRIFASYVGTGAARVELYEGIIKALRESGGVKGPYLTPLIEQVITNITGDMGYMGKMDSSLAPVNKDRRKEQRRRYLTALWRKDHHGANPPWEVGGFRFGLKLGMSPEEEKYLAQLNGDEEIELPIGRKGSLIQEKTDGKK